MSSSRDACWVFCFEYLTAPCVGRLAVCCKELREFPTSDRFLWKWLFAHRFLGARTPECRLRSNQQAGNEGATEGPLSNLYGHRPTGEQAIGWGVRVFNEFEQAWKPGTVVASIIHDGRLWYEVQQGHTKELLF